MKKFLLLVFILSSQFVLGQSAPGIAWQRCYGGNEWEYARSIIRTSDLGYILAGSTDSNDGDVTTQFGVDDYWIVKIDSIGNLAWQKSFGGGNEDEGWSILELSNGYIVAGSAYSYDGEVIGNHGEWDFWILRLDENGNMLWQKTLGGGNFDEAHSIDLALDGGFIIAGASDSNDGDVTGNHPDTYGYNSTDCWIVKLDSNGNLLWQKSLGGSSYDYGFSIQQTPDSGFIVAADSYSNDGDVTINHGSYDYWIIKLDKIGNIQWQKSLGGSSDDEVFSIRQTHSGCFVAAGYSTSNDGDVTGNYGSYDYWIVKLDSDGNLLWQKSLGGSDLDEAYDAFETDDDHLIISGVSASIDGNVSENHIGWNIYENKYTTTGDFWIVELDSLGNLIWQKSLGGSNIDAGHSACKSSDNGIAVFGNTWSNNGDVSGLHGYASDYWVAKLSCNVSQTFYVDADSDGFGNPNASVISFACSSLAGYVSNDLDCDDSNANVNPLADEIQDGIDDNCNGVIDEFGVGIVEMSSRNNISVFPNPASDFITFDLSNFPNKKFSITIYNSNGQQVNRYSNLHSSQLTIPVSQLGADGLYFYTMTIDEKKFYLGKFLVQR